ncbi:MAG TPA: sugar phosphate isomerase/epimerase [Armatimonadetes bacterium]|nr:sugar phosphate isomerase/epimerase [Armatimonadota bacterium]
MVEVVDAMKLACQEGLVPGASLEEKLDKLAEWGYEGIEFGGAGLAERADAIKRAVEGHPVRVSTICAGYRGTPLDADTETRQTAVRDIKELLSIAADIGAVGLIFVPIFGGPRIPDLSPYKSAVEMERELLLCLLDDLGEHAERVGAYLLLEPLNRYETHFLNRLEQAVEICNQVGNPYVRIMADFFHMNIEEADIPASIRQAGEWIYHVHLADSNRLLPGLGHTDFQSGFVALKEIGFDKYMALECGVPGDPNELLPKTAAYLKECM